MQRRGESDVGELVNGFSVFYILAHEYITKIDS